MSTTTSPRSEFQTKAAKAAKERIRKAAIKSAETKTPVTVVGFDVETGTFEIGSVSIGGAYDSTGSPSFATMDDAKSYLKTAAAASEEKPEQTDEQPAAAVEPSEPVGEFEPRGVYLYVFDTFAASVSDVAAAFGVEKPKARRALKKLESRGVLCSMDVNDEGQGDGRKGQYGEVVFQSALGTYDDLSREQAESAYDELAAAEAELKGSTKKTAAPGARSQGRKLVHEATGLIIRMSERAQATCIAETGDLPKIGDTAFIRADGTKTADIAASAAASGDDE